VKRLVRGGIGEEEKGEMEDWRAEMAEIRETMAEFRFGESAS
jgi:hypothetical protein